MILNPMNKRIHTCSTRKRDFQNHARIMGYLIFYLDCSSSKLKAVGIGLKVYGENHGAVHGLYAEENLPLLLSICVGRHLRPVPTS